MPTYDSIRTEVRNTGGFIPKTCWIADCLQKSGIHVCRDWNRADVSKRKHPCPPKNQQIIY
jgi:hypothetical protein